MMSDLHISETDIRIVLDACLPEQNADEREWIIRCLYARAEEESCDD